MCRDVMSGFIRWRSRDHQHEMRRVEPDDQRGRRRDPGRLRRLVIGRHLHQPRVATVPLRIGDAHQCTLVGERRGVACRRRQHEDGQEHDQESNGAHPVMLSVRVAGFERERGVFLHTLTSQCIKRQAMTAGRSAGRGIARSGRFKRKRRPLAWPPFSLSALISRGSMFWWLGLY